MPWGLPVGSERIEAHVPDPETVGNTVAFLRSSLATYPEDAPNKESIEDTTDLLEEIRDGEVNLVYPCSVHELHQNGIPFSRVTYVAFRKVEGMDMVHLQCGHKMLLPEGMTSSKGEIQPCVWCYDDCHS